MLQYGEGGLLSVILYVDKCFYDANLLADLEVLTHPWPDYTSCGVSIFSRIGNYLNEASFLSLLKYFDFEGTGETGAL